MFRQYQKFQIEKGLEIQISEPGEIIFLQDLIDISNPPQVSIIGLRSWSKLIFRKIFEAITKGDNFTRENFEKTFLQNNGENELALLLREPKKAISFFFEVFKNSLGATETDNYREFQIPSRCFELILGIIESYFGEKIKVVIVDNFQKSLKSMFRNMVLGGKGAGKFIKIESKDELIQWLTSFKKEFSKFGLVCPTIEEIKTELKRYIEDIQDNTKAEQIKRKLEFLFENDKQ